MSRCEHQRRHAAASAIEPSLAVARRTQPLAKAGCLRCVRAGARRTATAASPRPHLLHVFVGGARLEDAPGTHVLILHRKVERGEVLGVACGAEGAKHAEHLAHQRTAIGRRPMQGRASMRVRLKRRDPTKQQLFDELHLICGSRLAEYRTHAAAAHGQHLVRRHAHGPPPLVRSEGVPATAIHELRRRTHDLAKLEPLVVEEEHGGALDEAPVRRFGLLASHAHREIGECPLRVGRERHQRRRPCSVATGLEQHLRHGQLPLLRRGRRRL